MRMARRMGLIGKKAPAFVWEVYNTAYGRDTVKGADAAGTGSFRVTSTSYYWYVSTSYTATSSKYSLTSSSRYNVNSLRSGQFFVSNSATGYSSQTGSSLTSGTYLFEITSITTSNGYKWVNYRRWSIATSKGSTLTGTVSSNTFDYPSNGSQGNNWYVLIVGEAQDGGGSGGATPVISTRYVWERYSMAYSEVAETYEQLISDQGMVASKLFSTQYTVTPNGMFQLLNSSVNSLIGAGFDAYCVSMSEYGDTSTTTGTALYRKVNIQSVTGSGMVLLIEKVTLNKQKGTLNGTVNSTLQSSYPGDGEQNGQWYTLTSYETEVT